MRLTRKILRASYDFLCQLPPYNRMRLPPSSKLRFVVSKRTDILGEYLSDPPTISVSLHSHEHVITVLKTVAHEMIHAHQDMVKKDSILEHNAAFKKTARRVASLLGFDPKEL